MHRRLAWAVGHDGARLADKLAAMAGDKGQRDSLITVEHVIDLALASRDEFPPLGPLGRPEGIGEPCEPAAEGDAADDGGQEATDRGE